MFSLCDSKNCFVYKHCELFGNELTVTEIEFWGAYNLIQNAQFFKINYRNLTFNETIEEIENQKRKQNERMNRIGKK